MTTPSLLIPADYPRIKIVRSFQELISTPMTGEINALCWTRTLPGDFREIVAQVEGEPGIQPIDESTLRDLSLNTEGNVARDILLGDLELLRSADLLPELDCVTGSLREPAAFPTDVYSFHADSATVAADTYLCSYAGACSEGLRNDDAIARIDLPEARAELLALHGGADDESFREFLNENFHDLHYVPRPGAQPFSFGLHNLWRIALDYPGAPVPPCIHRAPLTLPGMDSRLLLLS